MKTYLLALVAAFVACASCVAQSPGSGNIVLQNQATIYSPTIVTPILNVPSVTIASGGNTYALTPVVTGTANAVITGGTTSTTLSGTIAVAGAVVGNSVFILQGVTLPVGATIYGNVANSGTAVVTIAVTGTTVITTGTYPIITSQF